jgi:hypothetical protein
MPRIIGSILVFAAFFFPLSWIGVSLVRAGPALVEAATTGQGVARVWTGFDGVRAVSGSRGRGFEWVGPAAAALILILLRGHALAGLFAACAGFAATESSLLWMLFGGRVPNVMRMLLAAVCVAVTMAGLRRMLRAVDAPGRWERVALLTGGFAAPVALLNYDRWPVAGAAALLVLAAAVLPAGQEVRGLAGWRWVGLGTAASLLLAGGLFAAQETRRAARAVDVDHAIPAAGKLFFQKGVNLTAEFPDGYDSDRIGNVLDELSGYGVDAVALVPYGFSGRGTATVQFGGRNTMEGDDGVAFIAAQAHRRGMKVFLKPQVWVGRGYPGDLDYPEAAPRAKWFAAYGRFVDHYAELATQIHADLFAVGVEFGKLTVYEREWRELIARARRAYPGPVTYAANFGPEFEGIKFWDAVDYIGLNDYYPLPPDLRVDDVVAKVAAVQKRFGKPVIFPEVGVSSVVGGEKEPWAEPNGAIALDLQARAYEALLRGFYGKPWFQGMYWWKVGTNGFGGPQDPTHTPWHKPAMDVVGRWYKNRTR